MGAWGTAIFSDDVACDVRDAYRILIEDGIEDDDAADRLIADFVEVAEDPEDGPVFWIALAVTQSKIGRLRDDIKQQALAAIDSGADLLRWQDDGARRRRRLALDKARAALEGPQPPRRKLRPPARHETTLRPEDLLAHEHSNGVQLFRVARLDVDRFGSAPVLVPLDYDGGGLPALAVIHRLNDRIPTPDPRPGYASKWPSSYCITPEPKTDFADAGFTVIGRFPARAGDETLGIHTYLTWRTLANGLHDRG